MEVVRGGAGRARRVARGVAGLALELDRELVPRRREVGDVDAAARGGDDELVDGAHVVEVRAEAGPLVAERRLILGSFLCFCFNFCFSCFNFLLFF